MEFTVVALAQDTVKHWQDSMQVRVGTMATFASKDFQPFWMVMNQYGTIIDRKQDFSTNLYVSNQHLLTKHPTDSGKNYYPLILSYTADIYNHNHFEDFTLVEGNVKLAYRGWQIRAGRYREIIGEVDPTLSTGSMGLSANALPIPKVGIAVLNYKNVPFTNGWLQFKGLISHGWMGKERYLRDSYLHEKAFYLRLGRGKLKLYGGAVHFGEWGGIRKGYKLDRNWKGFFDVLFVKEANDGSLPPESILRPNRAGAQRGLLEFGADLESKYGSWHFYHQTPFESGTGIDIRNIDRLAGLSLTFKGTERKLKKVLIEYIHTKQMEEYGGEKQSYYNNGAYKTGWEYLNMIIGTPLFINRVRGSHFLRVRPLDWHRDEYTEGLLRGNGNIISNRIIGGNIGAEYSLFEGVKFRTNLTYNVHFMGRSAISHLTNDRYKQFYMLQSVEHTFNRKWIVTGSLTWDAGDFYHNFGVGLGMKYIIF
jgi:hypothetical protein